jgi:hypothetical protein
VNLFKHEPIRWTYCKIDSSVKQYKWEENLSEVWRAEGVQFHIPYIKPGSSLKEKSIKTSIWAATQLCYVNKRIRTERLQMYEGKKQLKLGIIISLNDATDRLQAPHLHLFLTRRLLGRTKVHKNRAGVPRHAVDGVLPFLICFEAYENQSSTCCWHGKIITPSVAFHAACIVGLLREVWQFSITYFECSLRRHGTKDADNQQR